jgi:hypothetical protein
VSRAPEQPVYSVTGVRRGTSDDLAQRQRRYLISMSIRTVCFVLAVVTHGPVRWILVAAAVVLPYIAVVMANAVGSTAVDAPTPYVPQQPALDSAQRTAIPYEPQRDPAAATPKYESESRPKSESRPQSESNDERRAAS